MQLIDQQNAEHYLRAHGRVGLHEPLCVSELAGGVSNMVLLVELIERPHESFVLKQARAQLRTVQPWYSSVERVWREAQVLRICDRLLHAAPATASLPLRTPRILFEDRDNYLFAMTAAPRTNVAWKHELLAGHVNEAIAASCGTLLGTLHGGSWRNAEIAAELGDTTLFDQLRVDPYYRALAAAHPEAREPLQSLIDSLSANRCSLVHADFSPKNLLVHDAGLMMVDFETGHYGDPAFDLGFFLSHLVLKAAYHAPRHARYLQLTERFRAAYDEVMRRSISAEELADLWSRSVLHFAGCAWARLDGKSPVEYLTDHQRREQVRGICRQVLARTPRDWPQVIASCERALDE